jgi:hypothetical protein
MAEISAASAAICAGDCVAHVGHIESVADKYFFKQRAWRRPGPSIGISDNIRYIATEVKIDRPLRQAGIFTVTRRIDDPVYY